MVAMRGAVGGIIRGTRCGSVAGVGGSGRRGVSGDLAVLSAALDSLVGVFVELSEIFPQLFIVRGHRIAVSVRGELEREVAQCLCMEFVLVRLHVESAFRPKVYSSRDRAPDHSKIRRTLRFPS